MLSFLPVSAALLALGDTGSMGSGRFTGLPMPSAERTMLPTKAGIELWVCSCTSREGSSKGQEEDDISMRVKKESKELNPKEPILGWTVDKQEGTFLCHQPYYFGNKNCFSRNNFSIQQEKVLSCKAPVLRKFPGELTFLSRMYRQFSRALPVSPTSELNFGGILKVSTANLFPPACYEWTKIR